jgi:hypothetical protein
LEHSEPVSRRRGGRDEDSRLNGGWGSFERRQRGREARVEEAEDGPAVGNEEKIDVYVFFVIIVTRTFFSTIVIFLAAKPSTN